MGKLYTKAEIEALITEDGTYEVTEAATFNARLGFWEPDQRLSIVNPERGFEIGGFEIGYYEVLNAGTEVESVYLSLGDRLGRWTDENGRVVWDRTFILVGPKDIAEAVGRELNQKAIWNWSTKEVIDL